MSFSGVGGGFQGDAAILAFAAIQQGRMNEEMTESMRLADLRSRMSGELADLKSHLHAGIEHPAELVEVDQEMQAFLDKYGDEPALEDVTSTIRGIQQNIHGQVKVYQEQAKHASSSNSFSSYEATADGFKSSLLTASAVVSRDLTPDLQGVSLAPLDYADETIKTWISQISEKVDASGTNDQLEMIHIRQLNDNINNSSGVASGIIESRSNAMSSIINNIA
jgi:hypothetical protein